MDFAKLTYPPTYATDRAQRAADAGDDAVQIKDFALIGKNLAQKHPYMQHFEIYHATGSSIREDTVHHHDFYEVNLILNGCATYNISGRTLKYIAGDLLLVPPLELHQVSITSDLKTYERIILWIDKNFFESTKSIQSNLLDCFSTAQLRPSSAQRKRITDLLKETQRNYVGLSYGDDLMALTYLLQSLVEINRAAMSQQPINDIVPDKNEHMIASVIDYINENYADDISLDLLAKKFFISKYYLSHEFQRRLGISVYKYLIQKRLTSAKRLLLDGFSPTEVYALCGFGDYANFYRAFKTSYQISPKEFVQSANLHYPMP